MEEGDHDEFECSECDYKTFSEANMIAHSVTHRGHMDENINAGVNINNRPNKNANDHLGSSEHQNKRELNTKEENVIDYNSLKKIKLENTDIDSGVEAHTIPHQGISIDVIKQETILGLAPPKTENSCLDFENETFYSKANLFTEDGISVSNRDKQRHISSDDIQIELNVDNTGKYIPLGWHRKVYQYQGGICRVVYISPDGRKFHCKSKLYKHIERFECESIKLSVNIEDMDFISDRVNKKLHIKSRRKKNYQKKRILNLLKKKDS